MSTTIKNVTSKTITPKNGVSATKVNNPKPMKMWRYRAAIGDFVDDYDDFTQLPNGKFVDNFTLLVHNDMVQETWISAPKNPKSCISREQLEAYATAMEDIDNSTFNYDSFYNSILKKLKKTNK